MSFFAAIFIFRQSGRLMKSAFGLRQKDFQKKLLQSLLVSISNQGVTS